MSPQLQRPAWEAYALARTAGHSESESYRRAYPNASNWKPLSRARRARRLEANPLIKARLAELRADAAQRNHIEADTVIQSLMRIIDADICDFAQWKKGIVTLKDSDQVPREKMGALQSLSLGPNGGLRQIKMVNRIAALQTLAKNFLRPEDTEQIGTFIYNVIRHETPSVDHEPEKLLEGPQTAGKKSGAGAAK